MTPLGADTGYAKGSPEEKTGLMNHHHLGRNMANLCCAHGGKLLMCTPATAITVIGLRAAVFFVLLPAK